MNFDHVGKAYLSLFEVAIFKGWTAVLYDAGDSREVKLLKKRKQNSSREMHAFTLAQHFFIGLMQFWVKSQHFFHFYRFDTIKKIVIYAWLKKILF